MKRIVYFLSLLSSVNIGSYSTVISEYSLLRSSLFLSSFSFYIPIIRCIPIVDGQPPLFCGLNQAKSQFFLGEMPMFRLFSMIFPLPSVITGWQIPLIDIVYDCLVLQPPLGRNESSSEIIRQVCSISSNDQSILTIIKIINQLRYDTKLDNEPHKV